ncbi:MAG: VWA domain-containing protein, partial [Myxococcales bacterium]|nr:VWA domain-containing protein [Myxococcales bacterium]
EALEDAAPAPMAIRAGASRSMAYAPPPAPAMAPMPDIRMPSGEFNTEEYAHIDEAPFKSTMQDPLSTFSIDVDTASYANARRFIEREGRLPPPDAVRLEEFINYFDYDYPNPTGEHPFSVTTEVSSAPWAPAHRLVHIGLQGRKIDTAALPASNLVFLLDVSGSMNSPDKLPLLKQAFKMLVRNLRPHDKVAIVVYAGAAGLVLPSTNGKDQQAILDAIDRLSAGGSTAGGAGIKLAYQIARDNFIKGGNNRIILATDGDFNVGVSSQGDLVRMIEEERKSGVFLTILGFGGGNYKDSKMEELSNKGNGNAAYIDNVLEAKKVLVTEMGGTLLTIAKDVKIQVEFNPAKVKGYRLLGYENRALANRDFNDDTKDAGELGAGHTVTVLYEIIPTDSKEPLPGVDALKYQTREVSDAAKASPEMLTVKLRYKQPDGDKSTLLEQPLVDQGVTLSKTSADFRFSAAVAEMAMVLRGSKFSGDASYAHVIERASGALGKDTEGYRAGFVQLARRAQAIAEAQGK